MGQLINHQLGLSVGSEFLLGSSQSHRIVSVGRDLWQGQRSRSVSRGVWNVSREGDSPPDLGQILKISWGQAAGKVGMEMCEALSSLEMGFLLLSPFGQQKTAEPSLLCSPGVFGCSLKHSQVLWEAGFSLCLLLGCFACCFQLPQ